MAREMKDSGIEWIGEIPSEWKVYPARCAFTEIRAKNADGSITNALKFYNGTITPKTDFDADSDEYVAETITNYTVVHPDTIMINGLNLNYDLKSLRVGLVKETGVITSAYLALWPDKSRILPRFANYLFKGYETKMAFHNMGAGIRKTLGFKEFKRQPILLPLIPEQSRIADFLDAECARIDEVIEKTRASIEEYKKLKQSAITEAVTKGIRKNRPMKDSGIEWIGETPAEWSIIKLKYIFSIIGGNGFPDSLQGKETGDYPFCKVSDINGKSEYVDSALNWVSKTTAKENGFNIVPIGSIIMAKIGAALAKNHRKINRIECCIDNNTQALVHRRNDCIRYLYYLTKCIDMSWFDNNSTVPSVNNSKLLNFYIPDVAITEQDQIADYLDAECARIDEVINSKSLLLAELETYKKSLIFEYVTGKKEVISD